MNLGENIREARKAAGVTQKELAEYLDVYQKDISRWENGEQIPVRLPRIILWYRKWCALAESAGNRRGSIRIATSLPVP